MTSNKLDPSLVAILVNREHSRLSNQIKALEKVLRAPYSDKEHQRLLTLAAQLKGSGSLNVASRVIIFPFVAGHSSWQES